MSVKYNRHQGQTIPGASKRLGPLRTLKRMFHFLFSLVWHTARLAFSVRRIPDELRPLHRAERQQRACARFCEVLGVTVKVRGEVKRGGELLVASTHLGLLDPWVLASVIPIAFVAKAEMNSWPVMGWVCRTVGIIFVDRNRRMDSGRFVRDVQERMKMGVRVLVFPEGTVGDGRHLLQFKTGGFEAVANTPGTAVLPIMHFASAIGRNPTDSEGRAAIAWHRSESLFQHAWRVCSLPGIEIEVRIGSPIPGQNADRRTLSAESHRAVLALGNGLIESSGS